jgi:hypothetical protein
VRAVVGKNHGATRLVQHCRVYGSRGRDAQILDRPENSVAILEISTVGLGDDLLPIDDVTGTSTRDAKPEIATAFWRASAIRGRR